MKIIKHAKDSTNSLVVGQLLGIDRKGVVEVSDSFALPSGALASAVDSEKELHGPKIVAVRYTSSIMSRLVDLNSDACIVGFYLATSYGQHLSTPGFIDALLAAQQGYPIGGKGPTTKSVKFGAPVAAATPNSPQWGKPGAAVALVYDVAASSQGSISLKAFRLSSSFLEAHKTNTFDLQSFADHRLTSSNILEELPVVVQSTSLLSAFLSTLPANPSDEYASFSLPTSTSQYSVPPSLTHTASSLIQSLESHSSAQSTLSFQLRQLARERTRLEQAGGAALAKRKAENEERKKNGLAPLPPSTIEEIALNNLVEPSRLEVECALAGVRGGAEALSEGVKSAVLRMVV
ncbi:hypothetical protein BT69DRAFT_941087 [Atractiella rhizophila]|nr:hypothetical protein BT69DRAFT_941087 [Atractiella rhizophila]